VSSGSTNPNATRRPCGWQCSILNFGKAVASRLPPNRPAPTCNTMPFTIRYESRARSEVHYYPALMPKTARTGPRPGLEKARMDMSVMAVDVDGSLSNPIMFAATIIFAIVLATYLTSAFCFINKRWVRVIATGLIAVIGCIVSPFANRFLALLLYRLTTNRGGSVGFFGSPPYGFSPLLAFAAAGVSTLAIGRQQKPRQPCTTVATLRGNGLAR